MLDFLSLVYGCMKKVYIGNYCEQIEEKLKFYRKLLFSLIK
ncbi:MAG: hypothetical protein HPY66_0810 [Firmicutes bacterium]|nr:hypothetical protein [Bacillota bacterium]